MDELDPPGGAKTLPRLITVSAIPITAASMFPLSDNTIAFGMFLPSSPCAALHLDVIKLTTTSYHKDIGVHFAEVPGMTVRDLAGVVAISNQLALYHVRRLVADRVLRVERRGMRFRVYAAGTDAGSRPRKDDT